VAGHVREKKKRALSHPDPKKGEKRKESLLEFSTPKTKTVAVERKERRQIEGRKRDHRQGGHLPSLFKKGSILGRGSPVRGKRPTEERGRGPSTGGKLFFFEGGRPFGEKNESAFLWKKGGFKDQEGWEGKVTGSISVLPSGRGKVQSKTFHKV